MKQKLILAIFIGLCFWSITFSTPKNLLFLASQSISKLNLFRASPKSKTDILISLPRARFHQKPKPLAKGAITSSWTSFLGPTHNSVSNETKLLKKWSETGPPLVWELDKGTGYTSPAILNSRLVYFYRHQNQEVIDCLHPETGNRYWKYNYPTQYRDRYGYNNGPRSSPVIDSDRVYTYGAEGKLHCLNLKTGKIIWKRDLLQEFNLSQDFFGIASTPLIEGKALIVVIGAPNGPTVGAFDKFTGKLIWGTKDKWGASYASPIPATVDGKRRIFVFAGGESRPPTGGLLSINPIDGAIDFRFPWRSQSYESVNASCPVIIGNQVFISASYKTGAALINTSLRNSPSRLAWTASHFGLHWNTPIYKTGYLYGFDGRNEPDAALTSIDLKTGKEMWRAVPEWEETIKIRDRQLKRSFSTYRGSLLWADDHFLCLGEMGHLLWLDLSPKGYRILARTWLFAARETWSPLVLSNGLLYVSQNRRGFLKGESPRLLCYDLRASL
jgi:outer membrane protein assembly factor BamB